MQQIIRESITHADPIGSGFQPGMYVSDLARGVSVSLRFGDYPRSVIRTHKGLPYHHMTIYVVPFVQNPLFSSFFRHRRGSHVDEIRNSGLGMSVRVRGARIRVLEGRAHGVILTHSIISAMWCPINVGTGVNIYIARQKFSCTEEAGVDEPAGVMRVNAVVRPKGVEGVP